MSVQIGVSECGASTEISDIISTVLVSPTMRRRGTFLSDSKDHSRQAAIENLILLSAGPAMIMSDVTLWSLCNHLK